MDHEMKADEFSFSSCFSPIGRCSPFIVLSALLLLQVFPSCSRPTSPDNQATTQELTVAAAANLTDAFAELGRQFTARTGVRVRYSFGSTADLAKQIENGAPFDLFASADVEHVDQLERQGLLVAGTRAVYGRGRLVLWTAPGSRVKLERLEDLTRAEVERIGIAKPETAPYGRATVEALRALNLWQAIEPKVIYGQNVSQVKQYAATANVDAAFIPSALVRDGEGSSLAVDERLHQPLDQALALVKTSGQQEAARRFRDFVLSTEGQALLERYGYRQPR